MTADHAHELAQTCYSMAYFLLPRYIYNEPDKVARELSMGRVGALFFFFLTCKAEGKEPDDSVIDTLDAHTGSLDEQHDYYIIQYPQPPHVDLSTEMEAGELDPEKMMAAMQKVILAPYFSAMIREKGSGAVRYFILGQSPDGATTLRTVTPEMNANLGRGCEPTLDAFLELLRDRALNAPAVAGVYRQAAPPPKRWWQVWKR